MPRRETSHAAVRCQQQGIPPLIRYWLLDYGEARFDGRGAVLRYFSPASVRRLGRDVGRAAVRSLHEFLRCYLVESADDGSVITAGKRYRNRRLRRP